ncbi:MAG TPA: 3-oxoacyl-ACP reductase [Candidatus Acidoferrum sp.]|nr:3-oxoacyl-ACP reductase [Candidatus Acidoferrum sp.]
MKLKLKVPLIPEAVPLRRYAPGQPLVNGPVLVGLVGRVRDGVVEALTTAGVDVQTSLPPPSQAPPGNGQAEGIRLGAIILDATAINDVAGLAQIHAFLAPAFRHLGSSGRLIVFGTPPEGSDPEAAAAQRALDGFIRSAAKEARRGSTANLIYVAESAEGALESTLRFFLSGRSAYVDGQVIRVRPARIPSTEDWNHPLKDRVAVVTGAARGIGAAIAEVLARDGAKVVVLDVPAQGGSLSEVANRIGGTAYQIDITAEEAPARLAGYLVDRHGGADIFVHNAGITRDRSLVNMTADQWASVLNVNLQSQLGINETLLEQNVLHESGRIISISSTSGIAGNRGQTNYAASKAGIIGMVQATAPEMAKRGMTINAVAPGFIETAMTKAMPFAAREIGRRINSLNQGGLPIDVAETVAWLAQPGSAGVNGQVVRVCGQSMVGA